MLVLVHATLGEAHWLALSCKRVAPLKVTKDRTLPFNPLPVAAVHALAARLEPHHARTLWALVLTGMRPEEMFEEAGNTWSIEGDGVRIHGTKSAAADRVVPRAGLIVKPATRRLAFYRALRRASAETVAPYDLQRTYSQWLETAGVHPFRLRFYMGQGARDVTQRYQRMREVEPYLAEDARRLSELVGATEVGEAVALRVVR